MRRRDFLSSVGGSALSANAAGGAPPKPRAYRVIDTHLHLFNTRLQGKGGVPVYVGQDATVEAALVAMARDGGDEAAPAVTHEDFAEALSRLRAGSVAQSASF